VNTGMLPASLLFYKLLMKIGDFLHLLFTCVMPLFLGMLFGYLFV
jgi:hypothetical protein